MIQVQPDRFLKNWRREGQGEQYSRYEACKSAFERDFTIFEDFLAKNHPGEPPKGRLSLAARGNSQVFLCNM
jgi:hypothetical protein